VEQVIDRDGRYERSSVEVFLFDGTVEVVVDL